MEAAARLTSGKRKDNKTISTIMKSETKNGVLVISLKGNLLGEHVNGPVMELIKGSIEAGNKRCFLT